MDVSYQTITPQKDFWENLSPAAQKRIQQGLDDVEAGRYSSLQSVMEQLLSK